MKVRLTAVAGLIWASASMSVGILSFTLASIIKSLNASRVEVQLLAASTTIGMLIGALIGGPLADRIGRKKICTIFAILFSISNMLIYSAPQSFHAIFVLRAIAGIGVGGLLPILAALVSELSKAEERGMNLCFLESFWAYGWLIALLITWWVLPSAGWQAAMAATGLISLALTLVSYPLIPQSPRYLMLTGNKSQALKIAEKYGLKTPEIKTTKLNIGEQISILFSKENRRVTVTLWIVWFTIAMGYYGVFIWLPKSVLAAKIPLIRSFQYLVIMTIAQIPGYYSAVFLVEKVGRKAILGTYLALTALSSFMYASSTTIIEMLLWGSLLSFFDLGSWAAIYAYTPEQYPTHARGLGSSWASAIGRIGAIIGPYIVPSLVAIGGWYLAFSFFALVHLIGAAAAFMGREMKGKELPEIT
ncbi:MAG: MFS transporter [Candidatus Methanomethylicota archaeon]|uniref:MFS transporter n=1 Tax=Thermoproteota archaeon TaxID=2056631 RepID=A0A497F215_9CREN|nr:MAG: MFS transporter [Candidatus Verstraetearchaeota archaeon]